MVGIYLIIYGIILIIGNRLFKYSFKKGIKKEILKSLYPYTGTTQMYYDLIRGNPLYYIWDDVHLGYITCNNNKIYATIKGSKYYVCDYSSAREVLDYYLSRGITIYKKVVN